MMGREQGFWILFLFGLLEEMDGCRGWWEIFFIIFYNHEMMQLLLLTYTPNALVAICK